MTEDTQEKQLSEKEVHSIRLEDLEKGDGQVREEFKPDELKALTESIKARGQVQPILITKGNNKPYQIVDGERRWKAYKKIAEQAKIDENTDLETKFSTIKAIYVEGDNKLLGILGNIARDDYNPMEMADALSFLKKSLGKDATDADVGKLTDKSRSLVTEYLSLLKLPKKIKSDAIKDSCVPFNKLKILAASEGSEAEKLDKYKELHKKYSTAKKATKEASQTMPNRRATAVYTRINKINETLESGDIEFDKVDDSIKIDLVKSLEATKIAAQNLIDVLQP